MLDKLRREVRLYLRALAEGAGGLLVVAVAVLMWLVLGGRG